MAKGALAYLEHLLQHAGAFLELASHGKNFGKILREMFGTVRVTTLEGPLYFFVGD